MKKQVLSCPSTRRKNGMLAVNFFFWKTLKKLALQTGFQDTCFHGRPLKYMPYNVVVNATN